MKIDTINVVCKNIFKKDKPNKEEFNRLFSELVSLLHNIKKVKKI